MIEQALDNLSGPVSSHKPISAKVHNTQNVTNDGSQQDTEPASGSGIKLLLFSREETTEYLERKENKEYEIAVDRLCLENPFTLSSDDDADEKEAQTRVEQGQEKSGLEALGVKQPGTEESGVDHLEGKKAEDSKFED